LRTQTIAERVNAERLALLGWSRAILLQLAHPLVAAGVADHSTFREGRLMAARRLHHTVGSMLSLTFGSEAERAATLELINGIHRRVNGVLREDTGVFRAGTRYSAEDPALLLWVHATLIDSMLLVYARLVAPVTDAERDEYCREAAPLVRALGASDGVPETFDDVQRYLARMYASGEIVVSREARDLAGAVIEPPLSWIVAPARKINRSVTLGLLPPHVRAQYGFPWIDDDDRAFERWMRVLRRARRATPKWIALWAAARRS
jgi:uncharacterized protein (DUF2236 family)